MHEIIFDKDNLETGAIWTRVTASFTPWSSTVVVTSKPIQNAWLSPTAMSNPNDTVDSSTRVPLGSYIYTLIELCTFMNPPKMLKTA